MEEKIKDLIIILGIGLHEIVIDLEVGEIVFNSIEWDSENDEVLLHIFKDEFDYTFEFSSLTSKQQQTIYQILSVIYN